MNFRGKAVCGEWQAVEGHPEYQQPFRLDTPGSPLQNVNGESLATDTGALPFNESIHEILQARPEARCAAAGVRQRQACERWSPTKYASTAVWRA